MFTSHIQAVSRHREKLFHPHLFLSTCTLTSAMEDCRKWIIPIMQKPANSATLHLRKNHLRHQCSWNADAINKLPLAYRPRLFCGQKRLQLIRRHARVDPPLNDSSSAP